MSDNEDRSWMDEYPPSELEAEIRRRQLIVLKIASQTGYRDLPLDLAPLFEGMAAGIDLDPDQENSLKELMEQLQVGSEPNSRDSATSDRHHSATGEQYKS